MRAKILTAVAVSLLASFLVLAQTSEDLNEGLNISYDSAADTYTLRW